MLDPFTVIGRGAKLNPTVTKILFAVPILIAVVAVVLGLVEDIQTAIIGGLLVIIAAAVLLAIANIAPEHLGSSGVWLVRFCILFFVLVTLTLFSAAAFDSPKPLPCLLKPMELCEHVLAGLQRGELVEPSQPAASDPIPQQQQAETPNRAAYTVYVQFAGFNRETVRGWNAKLRELGWNVPGEERIATAAGLREIRYRNAEDMPAAEALAQDFINVGFPHQIRVKEVRIIRENQLEVWISPG